jgi:probable rRNA maturation factor
MNQLVLNDRQHARPVDKRAWRALAQGLLQDLPGVHSHELAVHLVGDEEMTLLNETFLHHEGATDVITFDHSEAPFTGHLHGEIFICVDEAVRNARAFRTTWQSELARYLVHGCLHLLGHDDKSAAPRRRMKREENRLMRRLAKAFTLSRLRRSSRTA